MEHSARIIQKYVRSYLCKLLRGSIAKNFNCPICIDKGNIGVQLSCKHKFHIGCILKWVHCDQSCPLCRRHVVNENILKFKMILTKLIEIFKVPIESLLNFDSAPQLVFYNIDHHLYENMEKYVSLIHNNTDCLNDNNITIMYGKYKLFKELKREIHNFNQRARTMNFESNDPKISLIQKRLSLPLEFLINRNKDHQIEMIALDSGIVSRQIRARFCALNQIQKKIDKYTSLSFNNPVLSSSRSLVPVAFSNFRNQAALLAQINASFVDNFPD